MERLSNRIFELENLLNNKKITISKINFNQINDLKMKECIQIQKEIKVLNITHQKLEKLNNYNKYQTITKDQTEIGDFLNKINPNLEKQIKQIQNKLYNTKTNNQNDRIIKLFYQKINSKNKSCNKQSICQRSHNYSISVNETGFYEQRSNWEDQVEYKTNQTNQTNQSLIFNGFRYS
ncbi:unnamed protein product [Paramecium sonneborni]|uniref:Uncharacterized protein n=1 Tax=Paramecium sonneborni TaxID=65129 RepID=A0A8S1N774_9CILI|nr:unnamed protein product [Paramecium sonneborni]